MCDVIDKAMVVSKKLNLWEIVIFKLYIIAFSLVLVILFPVLLSLNLKFYIILFFILYIFSIYTLIKKEGNYFKKLFSEEKYKVFKMYKIFDFGVFKTTLFAFGLMLGKIFPQILDFNYIGIYALIVGFGMGYFVSILTKSK